MPYSVGRQGRDIKEKGLRVFCSQPIIQQHKFSLFSAFSEQSQPAQT
jgi:hypothetical protein